MPLVIRGLMCLASLGLLLQVDCGTLFALTGCLPEFQPLIETLSDLTTTPSGPIVLEPTTKTTTSGVFLAVENNTTYDVQVHFLADEQELIARVPTRQTARYELAAEASSGTVVTAQNLDLNGSWFDAATTQQLKFVNGILDEFVDENGLTHVFSSADLDATQNVLSQATVQRNVESNTIVLLITTPDPNIAVTTTEARTYGLAPGITGQTLTGTSAVALLDATGAVVPGSERTLNHTFIKQFPTVLQAIRERDLDPTTGAVVQDLTYDPPPAEVVAGQDFQFGQTITFRVNATTVSFVVSN
jgi:hypothetical protein